MDVIRYQASSHGIAMGIARILSVIRGKLDITLSFLFDSFFGAGSSGELALAHLA